MLLIHLGYHTLLAVGKKYYSSGLGSSSVSSGDLVMAATSDFGLMIGLIQDAL